MIRGSMGLLVVLLTLYLAVLPGPAQAEERNIYVGDLIQISVSAEQFTEDELRDKFKDFEIVKVEENNDGYLMTLRSFEPGEKKVALGNKEIVIDIKSTLDEIKRDGIFEGNTTADNAGGIWNWQIGFYVLLVVFLLSGGIYFRMYWKRGKIAAISPNRQFLDRMNGISADDTQYLTKLTFYFKEYIEAAYSCRIRGKTTAEIMDECSLMPGLSEHMQDIRLWLEESGRLKYSGIAVFEEKKQELHGRLVHLVGSIDERKGSGP